jgi:Fe-S-cluster containining protein
MPDAPTELTEAVQTATERPGACTTVRDIYARLQLEIDRRKPICVASGKCCHFESYGHRLYVTTLELATFLTDLKSSKNQPDRSGSSGYLRDRLGFSLSVLAPATDDGCPLQQDKLCGVHAIRPFGCRIFFCDSTATQWQQEQYEIFHSELKQLHARFDVPYFYVEWRSALAAIGVSG